MKGIAGILVGALIAPTGTITPGQPKLTAKDYDDFYTRVIPLCPWRPLR
jgi:hypothetical protein